MEREQLDKIIDMTDKVLSNMGLECIEAEFVRGEKILRLFIDWVDDADENQEPVNLQQCVKVNHVLDEDGGLDALMEQAYTLEVSSPGVERPLRFEKHFRSHIGSTVNVRLKEKIDGRREVVGTLLSVGADKAGEITVEDEAGLVAIPLSQMHKANIVFDWAAN